MRTDGQATLQGERQGRGPRDWHLPPRHRAPPPQALRTQAPTRLRLLAGRSSPGAAHWGAAAAAAPGSPAGRLQQPMASAAAQLGGGPAEPPPKPQQQFRFCRMCGGALQLVLPQGDHRWRHVCESCAFTDYQNPKMVGGALGGGRRACGVAAAWQPLLPLPCPPRQVVGCIVEHEGRLLLCRRGIEPQHGKWTVPAGFMVRAPPPKSLRLANSITDGGLYSLPCV